MIYCSCSIPMRPRTHDSPFVLPADSTERTSSTRATDLSVAALDIEQLVGRRVEYASAGLRSGGRLFVFRSEQDRNDTICAVASLPVSGNVAFERATVTR